MGGSREWTPYRDRMKEVLDQMGMRELGEWKGKDIRKAGEFSRGTVRGGLRAYTAEKAEKIALGDFTINGELHYGLCTIIPGEEYDLPIFISRWEERESEIGILVDIMPAVDSLIDEEYRKKYLESVEPLWNRFANLPGIRPEEDDVLRALCSIVYTAARVPIENPGMRLAALAPHTEYLKAYLAFFKDAAPIGGEIKKRETKRKREAIRKILSARYREILQGPLGVSLKSDIAELIPHIFF